MTQSVSRRSVLKWGGALAAAGVVGIGLGFGGDLLLRPSKTVTSTQTLTTTQTATGPTVTTTASGPTVTQTATGPTVTATATGPTTTITKTTSQTTLSMDVNGTVTAGAVNNGPHLVYVKNGRVIRCTPIPVPTGAVYPQFVAKGVTFSPQASHSLDGPVAIGYRKYTNASNRILYPMMRAGWQPGGNTTTGRGTAQYVRITMAQALAYVAQEMSRIKTTYGPSAIGIYSSSNDEHVGIHGIGNYTTAIELAFGGYTSVTDPTYSEPGWMYGGSFIWGFNSAKGEPDPTDVNWDVVHNSTMIIFWGTNPALTAMASDGPDSYELYKYLIQLGKKIVVVGPRYNETSIAFDSNVTHIPIIPGTDAAMMAAIAYVWIQNGTYNKSYVSTHTNGFDMTSVPKGAPANSSFSDYILGNTDGVPKTPQWASAICGVQARRITALAQDWASNTTCMAMGHAAPNRAEFGHEWCRMAAALLCMQGWGAPGVDSWNYANNWPTGNALSTTSPSLPTTVKVSNSVTQTLLRLGGFTPGILNGTYTWHGAAGGLGAGAANAFTTVTYPLTGNSLIKMMFCESGSHIQQRCNSNNNALAYLSPNLQFIVQVSPWWQGTCNYADIILPACTPLEQADLLSEGTIHNYYIYQAQAVQPLGDSMSDFDLAQSLATAFGVGQEFAGGQTLDQILETAYNAGTLAKTVTWSQFKTQGYAYNNSTFSESTYKPAPQENWYYAQATGSGLTTPSGAVEFFSQLIFSNLSSCPWIDIAPVPKYYARPGGRYGPNASKYPLDLLTPHRLFRFHSQYDNNTLLNDCYKVYDTVGNIHEPAYMSPTTASAYGLKDGDIVEIFNAQGATLAGVKVTNTLISGVVQLHQNSWWTPQNTMNPSPTTIEQTGCANVLTNDQGQSQFARAAPAVNAGVQIQKYTGGL